VAPHSSDADRQGDQQKAANGRVTSASYVLAGTSATFSEYYSRNEEYSHSGTPHWAIMAARG